MLTQVNPFQKLSVGISGRKAKTAAALFLSQVFLLTRPLLTQAKSPTFFLSPPTTHPKLHSQLFTPVDSFFYVTFDSQKNGLDLSQY